MRVSFIACKCARAPMEPHWHTHPYRKIMNERNLFDIQIPAELSRV